MCVSCAFLPFCQSKRVYNEPMTKDTKRTTKKPGRKGNKVRSHLSLAPNLNAAAEFLGGKTFGSKTAYLEHLILKDLERQGLDVMDVAKLAEEWRAKQEND